jgi:hypothetical protein
VPSRDILFFHSDSMPYGVSYGKWTARWWQWFLSTPRSINPVLDETGRFAHVNQPAKDVWFLAGKLADKNRRLPMRFCKVPTGRSILFPVINCEANPLEYTDLMSDQDLIDRVKNDEDTIIKKECFVDGAQISTQRIKSDPSVFNVKIDEDNSVNVEGGQITRASADGYWVFLKPLPWGEHIISFEGSCEYGELNTGANYRIEIK